MKLTDDIEQAWITALRSGGYEQCTGTLERPALDGSRVNYCCLGVLGKVLEAKGLADADVNKTDLPYNLAMERYTNNHNLVNWNDDDKATFATIADRIELGVTDVRYPGR